MNDPMYIIQIRQTLQHSERDQGDHIDIDSSYLLVNAIQRALVHELHTDADVGVGYERAIERDDVVGMAVMHDLQLPKDLFPHGGLRVNQHDLDGGSISRLQQ